MGKEFAQIEWGPELTDELVAIVRLSIAEDLGGGCDWTTASLVPSHVQATAAIVSRVPGVVAGMAVGPVVFHQMGYAAHCTPQVDDGEVVDSGQAVAQLHGPAAEILTAERPILNLMGRLSGIATLTSAYVREIAGTKAKIYDTRKTTPGYRRMEKFAVRCGGGMNHRGGLDQAILIKDNHLAFGRQAHTVGFSIADSIKRVRDYLQVHAPQRENMIVEIEVDSIEQLRQVLPAFPDIVLLDNMTVQQLRQAVNVRDDLAPEVELEASGGIQLKTVRGVAETGVDRISVGALTHSAPNLDLGLDWAGVE